MLRSAGSLARILILFGPDRGLVSERAKKAAAHSGVPLDDPFAVTQLDVTDIQKDHGRLSDEMNSIGLFGGEKLVWVKGANNEKPLIDGLAAVAESPPQAAWLIIEAGDLKKTSALRKIAVSNRNITAVPCYTDDARSLNELIDEVLSADGKKITPGARARLLESLGGDRIASRGEVRKLALYCLHDTIIEEQHVLDIIGDASATSIDDAIDALLLGNRSALITATQKILSSKTPIYQLLNSVLRQFQTLDLLRNEMDRQGLSASQTIADHGRQIFFKRKPIMTQALGVWTAPKIARELNRLQSTVLLSQRNPAIADNIAVQLLLSLTLQSVPRR